MDQSAREEYKQLGTFSVIRRIGLMVWVVGAVRFASTEDRETMNIQVKDTDEGQEITRTNQSRYASVHGDATQRALVYFEAVVTVMQSGNTIVGASAFVGCL
jgi:hypothetical protein